MTAQPMTAREAGALQNKLGILTHDLDAVFPKKLREITGYSPTELERNTGLSRVRAYQEEIRLKPNDAFTQKIIELVMVTDLADELFRGNREEVRRWLISPNVFFGARPFELCFRGQGDVVRNWLHERLGKIQPAY